MSEVLRAESLRKTYRQGSDEIASAGEADIDTGLDVSERKAFTQPKTAAAGGYVTHAAAIQQDGIPGQGVGIGTVGAGFELGKQHIGQRAVHRLAHDLGENQTRRTDERTSDD